MDWPWRISPSQNPEQGEGETGAATSPGVPSQAEHPHHAGAGSAVGWAGGGRRKCGGNVSSVLGNAAAGRGTEGPRGRAPTLSPCTAPSPTGTRRGPEGGPRGWHKAVFLPVLGARGPSAQHGWRGASGSGQAPPAASIQQLHPSLERKRGAASPPAPPPGWAACISSLALARASTGMGRRGQLASFPWDTRQQARCHGSGWKDFPAARSRGSVPAHSVPAPVSCHNRGCSRRCLVCGLVPVQTVSLGTGLAVCPA